MSIWERTRARRRTLSAAIWLIAVNYSTPRPADAQGQSPNTALSWHVPTGAGCATVDEIELRLAQLTDHTFAAGSAVLSFRILVRIAPSDDSGWRARIVLSDLAHGAEQPVGEREVATRLPDCRAIDVPVVLVMATLLDDLRQRSSAQAAVATTDGSTHDRVGIGAFGAAEAGLLPVARLGATLGVQLPSALPFVIDASAYLPYDQLTAGRGARVWLFHGGVSACPELLASSTSLQLQLCGGGQAGAIWGESRNLGQSRGRLRALILVAIEPRVSLRLFDGVWAQLSVAASWLPLRPGFEWEVRGQTYTLESSPFALIARIGVITFLR